MLSPFLTGTESHLWVVPNLHSVHASRPGLQIADNDHDGECDLLEANRDRAATIDELTACYPNMLPLPDSEHALHHDTPRLLTQLCIMRPFLRVYCILCIVCCIIHCLPAPHRSCSSSRGSSTGSLSSTLQCIAFPYIFRCGAGSSVSLQFASTTMMRHMHLNHNINYLQQLLRLQLTTPIKWQQRQQYQQPQQHHAATPAITTSWINNNVGAATPTTYIPTIPWGGRATSQTIDGCAVWQSLPNIHWHALGLHVVNWVIQLLYGVVGCMLLWSTEAGTCCVVLLCGVVLVVMNT